MTAEVEEGENATGHKGGHILKWDTVRVHITFSIMSGKKVKQF